MSLVDYFISILQSSIKTSPLSPSSPSLPRFQFYKVRLKPAVRLARASCAHISILQSSIKTPSRFHESANRTKISILQSSIKTISAFQVLFHTHISILQSSIKTVCRKEKGNLYIISILQSSIKTERFTRRWSRCWEFQFYKVRLKLHSGRRGATLRQHFNSTKFD